MLAMLRRLFTLLSALPLVVCMGTLALWAYLRDATNLDVGGYSFWLYGGVTGPIDIIAGVPQDPHDVGVFRGLYVAAASLPLPPVWVVVHVLRLFRQVKSVRWMSVGRCAACGYDLRATPN
jgi:hypothetical protein